jgi:hypothetical protein
MFFKALDPLFAPFRAIRNKIVQGKNKVGTVKVDVSRLKQAGNNVGNMGKNAMGTAQGFAGQAQGAAAQGQQFAQGAQGAMQQPGAPGAPPAGPPINPNPPLVSKGFWIFAKKFCSQCGQQMDKLWFTCPHCAQAAAAQAAAAAPKAAPKTMAFMLNQGVAASGGGPSSGVQVIGWLVPLQGPQRGELFTLGAATLIGTDPASCNLVLQDKFMSSKHAEIKVEAGLWMLKDLGSTNGTYVNDKRVDKQELVDNDFVKFGQALCRFKSL